MKLLSILIKVILAIILLSLLILLAIPGGFIYSLKNRENSGKRNLGIATSIIASVFFAFAYMTQTDKPVKESTLTQPEKSSLVKEPEKSKINYEELKLLPFKKEKQLSLGKLDQLSRASFAHIRLQRSDMSKEKREQQITVDPVGWHNYNLPVKDDKKAWLMNRGHLIGYQFSGLTNELKNLIPLTTWVNTGTYHGTDDKNDKAMLFYETGLAKWLNENPDSWLDYRVEPIYSKEELIPRQVKLQYVGLDDQGQLIKIKLGGRESHNDSGIATVVLENQSPNATIDYLTGTAVSILATNLQTETTQTATSETPTTAATTAPATEAATTPAVQAQTQAPVETPAPAPAPAPVEDRIVYVTQNGTNNVYWVNKSKMPKNTNWNKVVTMTESEAKAYGKRRSLKD